MVLVSSVEDFFPLSFSQVLNVLLFFLHLKTLKINWCFRQVTTPETAEFNTIITKICVLLHFAGKCGHSYYTIFTIFVSKLKCFV